MCFSTSTTDALQLICIGLSSASSPLYFLDYWFTCLVNRWLNQLNQAITKSINQSINRSTDRSLRFLGNFPSWIQIYGPSLINLNCQKKQEICFLNSLFSSLPSSGGFLSLACDNDQHWLTLPLPHEGSVSFSKPFGKQLMALDPIRLYPSLHLITRWPSFPTRTLALATLTWEQFSK